MLRDCLTRRPYFFFFLAAFFFAMQFVTSFRATLVAHRLAAQMLGLLGAAPLVVDEIRIELG